MNDDLNSIEKNQHSLMVSKISSSKTISKSGKIADLDKKLINSIELSKSSRLVIKNDFDQTTTDVKNLLNETSSFISGEQEKFEVGVDKYDNLVSPSLPLENFLKHNNVSEDALEFYYSKKHHFFKYRELSYETYGKSSKYIRKVVSIPTNHKGGIKECNALMKSTLPKDTYDNLVPYRVDYHIIYHGADFKDVNRRLIATRARSVELIRFQNKELTRYFGREPLKIAVYDMQKKHKIKAVKIEVRTWSKYIGFRHPRQSEGWIRSLEFNPFEQLKLLNFDYSTSNRKRMIQFNILAEVLGTQFAKSYLNTQSNASRDFKKLLFSKDPTNLSEIWEKGIHAYFDAGGNHDLKTSENEQ